MSALMKYCTAREDYGFEYNGGGEIVIEKYAKLPCKAKRYISTIEDNQTELDLRVSVSLLPLLHGNISAIFSLFRCTLGKMGGAVMI